MFKKFLNIVLTSAFIAGMSTAAYADNHSSFAVGASAKAYFGTYNSGVSGADSTYETPDEYNIKFKGMKGAMSWYGEAEFRGQGFTAAQNRLTYSADAFSASVGTIKNVAGLPHYVAGGTKTTATIAYGAASGVGGAFIEADGLSLNYKVAGFNIGYILADAGHKYSSANDNSSVITLTGKVADALDIRFASASSSDSAGTLTDTGMTVSVKYSMDMASVSFGQLTQSQDNGSGATATDNTKVGVQVRVNAGPGTVIVTSETVKTETGSTTSVDSSATNIVYDIPVEKGAGVQIVSLSDADNTTGGVTETYLGVGFYAGF